MRVFNFGTLNVLPMVTTKEIAVEHTQKEMIKDFSISLQNINYTQNKEEMQGQKAIGM